MGDRLPEPELAGLLDQVEGLIQEESSKEKVIKTKG